VGLTPHPLEAFFSSQRSWVLPFRAFLQPDDRKKSFLSPFPLVRFSTKPIGLASALQRLDPTRLAVPLLATQMINLGAGAYALLGFMTSEGSPYVNPPRTSFPRLRPPHVLSEKRPFNRNSPEPQGLFCQRPGYLPPKRAPAFLAFLTNWRLQPL